MKATITGALVALALITGGAPDQAFAAPIKECGNYSPYDGYGIYNITTRIVRCGKARRMARAAFHGDKPFPHGYVRWGSFNCTVTHIGIETDDLRCVRKGGGVVRWQMGA